MQVVVGSTGAPRPAVDADCAAELVVLSTQQSLHFELLQVRLAAGENSHGLLN